MSPQSRNLCLGVMVCVLALVVRTGMWVWDGAALHQDIDAYLEIAHHVAAGEGFSRGEQPHPTAYRPPLYPLLIAGLFCLGGTPWLLGGVQVVLGTLTTILTLRCGRLLELGPGRFLAAGLVALDPLLVRYTALPMTETLCAALAILWCWLVLEFPTDRAASGESSAPISKPTSALRGFFHGASMGLLCLCRPAFLAAAGLAALWILGLQAFQLCQRRSLPDFPQPGGRPSTWTMAGLASLVGIVTVLGPWIVRNAIIMGKPMAATTHGGYTFLLANNPVFYREVLDGPRGATWEKEGLLEWQTVELERGLERDEILPSDEVARDAWMYRRAWSHIKDEPVTFLRACVYRCGRFWSLAPARKAHRLSFAVTWAISLFYAIVSVGLILGLLRPTRLDWRLWSPLLLLPFTLWFTHLFYWTDTRMRAPVIPILALVAARGILTLRSHSRTS